MQVFCANCNKQYNIDSSKLAQIKKRKPKCKACGSYIFSSDEYHEETILQKGDQFKMQTSKYLQDQKAPVQADKTDQPEQPDQPGQPGQSDDAYPASIGPYSIEGVLGKGGMGTVYKGLDESLHRHVAIKTLQLAEKKHRERFLKEARALAKLSHPNITQIHSAGEDGGVPYFVMEYVDGPSTEQLLESKQRFPIPGSLDIVIQVCQGLKKANQMDIIHRDIKPGNILVSSDGTIKITDFGLAKLVTEDQSLTSAGMTLGTPSYISPEQGKGDKLDFRADIYALGVMLYRFIIGRLPFEADTAVALIMKHVDEPVQFPTPTADLNVPPAITGIIRKMMAKNPDDRFLSYDQLIDELARLKKSFQALEAKTDDEMTTSWQQPESIADPGSAAGAYNSQMDQTVMIPARSSGSSFRISPKLMISVAIIVLLGFFVFMSGWFSPTKQPEKDNKVKLDKTGRAEEVVLYHLPSSKPEGARPAATGPVEIEITHHTIEEIDENSYRVYGSIRNMGTNSVQKLSVEVALINVFNEGISTQNILTEPRVIMPGEIARFSLVFKEVEFLDHYIIKASDESVEGSADIIKEQEESLESMPDKIEPLDDNIESIKSIPE
jgi:serine/threonine protein kinase